MADRQGRQAGTIKTPEAMDNLESAVDALKAKTIDLASQLDNANGSSGQQPATQDLIDNIDFDDVDWKPFTKHQTGGGEIPAA